MEKVSTKAKKYRKLVKEIINEIAKKKADNDPVLNQTAFDDKNGQYLLLMNGWAGDNRFYACLIHIEVTNEGKIYVHEDRTEEVVIDILLQNGLTKKEIVVGFHPPIMRSETDFALA